MHLLRLILFFFIVTLLSAATVKSPEKRRPKRTIQYFFDGLLSILKDRSSYFPLASAPKERTNSRATNDRLSALVALAKLSSTSTQPRVFNLDDDDDQKPATLFQFPIPAFASTTLNSVNTRAPRLPMTKRIQDSEQSAQVNKSSSGEETSLPTSTMAPNRTVAKVIEPVEPTTIEPELSTISAEITTTLDPILAENINVSSSSQINATSMVGMERKIDVPKIPVKASDRHTTQSFGGPLVVERHRGDQHTPIYMDNCVEVNCIGNDSKEILPYLQPGSGVVPIISMTIALPLPKLDQRSKDGNAKSHYNVFTLHSIPIFHSHLLSNKIQDIQTKH